MHSGKKISCKHTAPIIGTFISSCLNYTSHFPALPYYWYIVYSKCTRHSHSPESLRPIYYHFFVSGLRFYQKLTWSQPPNSHPRTQRQKCSFLIHIGKSNKSQIIRMCKQNLDHRHLIYYTYMLYVQIYLILSINLAIYNQVNKFKQL